MSDLFPPPPLEQWPADLRDQYWERVAIMIADGELSESEAERLALAETWSKR